MNVLEAINTIIAATIPVLIFYFGYRIENRKKIDQEEKQRERDRIERKHFARIQFELNGKFFGPQEGYYLAELLVILHNKGLVRNVVDGIKIKVLGIKNGTNIEKFEWKNSKGINSIASFPIRLVDTDILNKNKEGDSFFVEPGVIQQFTYTARIPEDIRFILLRSSFKYHEKSEHSAQKIFEVKVL